MNLLKILVDSGNPAICFTRFVLLLFENNPETEITLEVECKSGHNYSLICERVFRALYNCMMKNYVNEVNSSARIKKQKSDTNVSSLSKKIKKLTSS